MSACGEAWMDAARRGYAYGWDAHQAAAEGVLRAAHLWFLAGCLALGLAAVALGLAERQRRRWWVR